MELSERIANVRRNLEAERNMLLTGEVSKELSLVEQFEEHLAELEAEAARWKQATDAPWQHLPIIKTKDGKFVHLRDNCDCGECDHCNAAYMRRMMLRLAEVNHAS